MNGGGISSGSISGGEYGQIGSGTIGTYNTSSGINKSLGYADFANGVFNGYNWVGNLFTGKLKVSGSLEVFEKKIGMYYANVATPGGGSKGIYYLGYG